LSPVEAGLGMTNLLFGLREEVREQA